MIKKLAKQFSKNARVARGKTFLNRLNPTENDKILDLGGGYGTHIASIIPWRKNVYIADIRKEALRFAEEQFGFNTIKLDEDGQLPFSDQYFDIVFSSSVIEHVTLSKKDLHLVKNGGKFSEAAYKRQTEFALEIRRIGKRYFVQTPNKYFLIESHTWLPGFIVFLPRSIQMALIEFTNEFWPKKTMPDWNLLTVKQMQELFPDAETVLEKSFGFTKSIMAIKI